MNETPPNAVEFEQRVLGSLLLDPAAMAKVGDWLTAEHFWRKDHQIVFAAIVELIGRGKSVDALMLGDWIHAQGLAELVAPRYVLELANNTGSTANVEAYAEVVVEKAKLREAIETAGGILADAMKAGASSQDVIAVAQERLAKVAGASRMAGPVSGKEALREWYADLQRRWEQEDRMTGVVTPWREVNDLTLGWQSSDLTIIAGRPNMGKSLIGFQAAGFAAIRGTRALIFSLEMSRRQVMQRMMASVGEIAHGVLRDPQQLDDQHWARITNGVAILSQAPIAVDDQAGVTAAQIVARAKREHMRSPVGLVLIDHLHDVRRPGKESVADELGHAARAFKALAKDLRCPVLLIAQLNRANSERAGHKPTLTDLRSSGEIEQIADLVLFAHRDDYYDQTNSAGVVELIVAKGRDMPTGQTILLKNRFDQMRVEDWDGPVPERPQPKRAVRGFGNPGADRAAA